MPALCDSFSPLRGLCSGRQAPASRCYGRELGVLQGDPSFLRTQCVTEVSTAQQGHPIRDSDPLITHWSASSSPGADINTQASDSASALYEACKNEHQLVVEFLLSQGADANKANKDGMLPLHVASKKGNYRSAQARPPPWPIPPPLQPTLGGSGCPAHRMRKARSERRAPLEDKRKSTRQLAS